LAPTGTTVTDLLVLAVARALRDVPDLNGVLDATGAARRSEAVNLALAVASPDGVVAPVIRDAGALALTQLSAERARLVGAARAGSLDKRDLGGATCTLSNLGAYPVDVFAPVISGPQIALIATGRLAEKPIAVDGMIAVRSRISVNAAIDHRGADGEAGGRFLAALERRFADLPTSI
jgi:pyruvate dehydrogenase E2 component (dihydrolipoamide acetyltransferase)